MTARPAVTGGGGHPPSAPVEGQQSMNHLDLDLLRASLPTGAAPPGALLDPWRPLQVREYGDYRGRTPGPERPAGAGRDVLGRGRDQGGNGGQLQVGDAVVWVGEVEGAHLPARLWRRRRLAEGNDHLTHEVLEVGRPPTDLLPMGTRDDAVD